MYKTHMRVLFQSNPLQVLASMLPICFVIGQPSFDISPYFFTILPSKANPSRCEHFCHPSHPVSFTNKVTIFLLALLFTKENFTFRIKPLSAFKSSFYLRTIFNQPTLSIPNHSSSNFSHQSQTSILCYHILYTYTSFTD